MSDYTLLTDTSHWSGDINFDTMYDAAYPQRLTGGRGMKTKRRLTMDANAKEILDLIKASGLAI